MIDKEKLVLLGLTEREAEAYSALFNFEETTASELAKGVKEHRTNIYDSLNGLIKKGLVACIIKNSIRYYKVVDPEKLLDYTKEKEKMAESLLPELRNRIKLRENKPIVEVFEGLEGFKSILFRILKEEKPLYGIGASEEWEKRFPIKLEQYMKEREKRGIRAKLLYSQGTKPIIHKLNEVKFLPKEFSQPSTIAIFGDYVAILMWSDPLVATLTKSRQLSKSFKEHFDALWKIARH
ncbi:MAG: helix-turn-helix domain-containing protein [Nanoarchaeota archaeon]